MDARQRYADAIGWIADHIAVVLFVTAFVGGLATAITASMSVLKAYAPLSYVVAGLSGAILTTFLIWSVWAFTRWVRHGAISGRENKDRGEDGVRSHTPPAPFKYEAPDIAEAKSRLCFFVRETLTPSISALNNAISGSAAHIQYGNKENILADLAQDRVMYSLVSTPPIEVFSDLQNIRAAELPDMELTTMDYINRYLETLSILESVVKIAPMAEDNLFTKEFVKYLLHFTDSIPKLRSALLGISTDVCYPRIGRRFTPEFILSTYFFPPAISRYLESRNQSAS